MRLENNGHLQLRWRLKEFSVDAGNTAGTWNHVAASYDGTNVKLYLNGVLLKSFVSNKVHNVVSPNILVIGSDPEGRDLIGKLDEVRIWDDVRTIDELIANMNLTLEGNEENLVAYYNFEDGAGTTLTDQTVNGNDATLINMAPTRDWQKANGFLSSKCSYQLSQTAQVTVSSLSSINQTLTVRNDSVISNEQNGDSYQWQNCTGTSTDIIGETNDKLKAPSSGDYSVVITKGACTITSNCEPVIISGINKNANNGVVKLYPNPTSSYLTIESDEKVNKVEVYTLNGELTTSFENEKRIDVAYLPTGVYTLMFYTEEGVYTQKLIKK